LHESDWPKISHAIGRLGEAPLYIDDNPNLTVMEIRAKARRLRSRLGSLGLIIVDYLQLMSGRHSAENRQVEVSEISRGLKILARELEVPVVALSQLSRNLEQRADKRPMLADLRESGCMPASTRILRADNGQEVTLGSLVLSQEQPLVWSLDDHWRLTPQRLVRAFPSGIRQVFQLRLSSGLTVDATANHPFRTINGWSRLDELQRGDFVAVPRRIPAPTDPCQPWDSDELILLAHLLGDGSIGPVGVKYATVDPANKQVVEQVALTLFGITVTARKQGNTWLLRLPSPYRLTHATQHPVRNWLEPLGLWDSRSHNKFVPQELFGLPDHQIALFLHHLWATDGSITITRNRYAKYVRIYYASTSRQLADDVQRLLLRLDIRSRISRVRKTGYRDCWHVTVTGGAVDMSRFIGEVGCHGQRSECLADALEILANIKPNRKSDLVPWGVAEDIERAAITAGVAQGDLVGRHGESSRSGNLNKPIRLSRERFERIGDILGDSHLRDLATSDVLWDEVLEVAPLGVMPTFDATVEHTHNFVSQGIIAHNSLEQDADVVMFLYRDEIYNPESPDRGSAEVIISKHRNGPTGVTRLAFNGDYTRFENMARV
jgi:replicative DNA helicase